ncbi:hypothetical protein [Helicobacter didelphidarum]|uniref:hypothetical protein n=1 Tax=Helicobacter didelphidarum TaxID=2040648 RepID=UPI0015F17374|nr:hypothetical protein [Helicobacter didelphidarum]
MTIFNSIKSQFTYKIFWYCLLVNSLYAMVLLGSWGGGGNGKTTDGNYIYGFFQGFF